MPSPECNKPAGEYVPLIDRNRCEGKAACERVCPKNVFRVGTLPESERLGLSLMGRLKGFGHRWQQALLVHAQACEACGKCIEACPEHAITLVKAR
jgi:4Fe-4S ferredoxin